MKSKTLDPVVLSQEMPGKFRKHLTYFLPFYGV
jgi:hypothetical protein